MFFEGPREHFFKPLSGKYREAVAGCLKCLYLRLHGPEADYTTLISRDELRDMFLPIVSGAPVLSADYANGKVDEVMDPAQRASWIIRELTQHGWIQESDDKGSMRSVYRLTRIGKLFTESMVALDGRGLKTRQRNVRNARNALESFVRDRDPFNIVDAVDYASRVISDLSDDITDLHDRKSELMREATKRNDLAAEFLVQYLERHFVPDISVRLSADSVERHRSRILSLVNDIRSWDEQKKDLIEQSLRQLSPDYADLLGGVGLLEHLLDQIEGQVDSACMVKMPELRSALGGFVRRSELLIRQASNLVIGEAPTAAAAIANLSKLPQEAADAALQAFAASILPPKLDLVDPASICPPSARTRHTISTDLEEVQPTHEERLSAALEQAESQAFVVDIAHIRQEILRQMGDSPSLNIRNLHIGDARDLLALSHCIEVGAFGYPNSNPRLTAEPVLDEEGKPRLFENPYGRLEEYIIRKE